MQLNKYLKIFIAFVSACVFIIFSVIGTYAFLPRKYKKEVFSACTKTEIDQNLVFAIIKAESSFNPNKISHKGAIGLMQIMPDTAKYISEVFFSNMEYDLYSPKDNILFGVTYLLYLTEKFKDEKTALAAYNAGEGRTKSWLLDKNYSLNGKTIDIIPYKETENYVKKVLFYKKIYSIIY